MEKMFEKIISDGKKSGKSIEEINAELKAAGANFHLNPDGGVDVYKRQGECYDAVLRSQIRRAGNGIYRESLYARQTQPCAGNAGRGSCLLYTSKSLPPASWPRHLPRKRPANIP